MVPVWCDLQFPQVHFRMESSWKEQFFLMVSYSYSGLHWSAVAKHMGGKAVFSGKGKDSQSRRGADL